MTKEEIISKVKMLNLPVGSYVVFGSCPLAVAGLREANDIDMLVTKEVYESLKQAGWNVVHKGPNDEPIVHDVFEAHYMWTFGSYSPTLEHLLSTATIIDGVPFASLQEVQNWKQASDRPKDLTDLALIATYLKTKK